MKDIYLLSGLGADHRIYEFVDFTGYHVHHVTWIKPLKDEKIENYARRLLEQIPDAKPTLIGVSFGGVMCVEIGKIIDTEKIILISSVRHVDQVPSRYKTIGKWALHKLMPVRFLKMVTPLTYWSFGTKTKTEKQLLRTIIKETDEDFLRWAVDKVLNWQNETLVSNVIQINGTADRIYPFTKADHIIKRGGHWMVRDNAEEISRIIREII